MVSCSIDILGDINDVVKILVDFLTSLGAVIEDVIRLFGLFKSFADVKEDVIKSHLALISSTVLTFEL